MQAQLRRRRSASLAKSPFNSGLYRPQRWCGPAVCKTPHAVHHSACDKISKIMPFLCLADGNPDPFGGGWHVDVIDLVLAPQALDDRIDHGGTGADRARLARALDAERVGRARHVVGFEME